MHTSSSIPVGRRLPLFLVTLALLGAPPAAADSTCELTFSEEDLVRRELGLHAGVYRCGEPIVAAQEGFRPVAARRLDLAGDGDADLLVKFRGEAGAEVDWLVPTVGSRLGEARALADAGAARAAVDAARVAVAPAPILLATRLDADGHPELVVALESGAVAVARIVQSIAVVNSTSEVVDFGGPQQIGDLPGPDGLVTLREAILAANNTAGADIVQFNIPSLGNDCHDNACWFTPSDGEAAGLPPITESLTLDGYTQTTNRGDTNPDGPELVLEGSGLLVDGGLVFQAAPNSAVIDLVISTFPGSGINAIDSDGLAVSGCYLGVDPTGTAAMGPSFLGIDLHLGSSGASIGAPGTHGVSPLVPNRNLVSGHSTSGIRLSDLGTDANQIRANHIGTDRTGTAALPNDEGITIEFGASLNLVGGGGAGEGNLISGNAAIGILLLANATNGNEVKGNRIGTTLDGLAALPNLNGVRLLQPTDSRIGGTAAGEGNLISGNSQHGVLIGGGAGGTTIEGNWIGLDATGTAALGNAANGVEVQFGSQLSVIGGTLAGARNVVSGNGAHGIHLYNGVAQNQILGNRIGTDAAGTAAVPNGANGVLLEAGADDNDIGDGTAAGRNVVSGNTGHGIELLGSADNRVRGNYVGLDAAGTAAVANLGRGIRLAGASTGNSIGGPAAGEGNYVVGSPTGIVITGTGTSGNLVRGNTLGEGPAATLPAFANGTGIRIDNGAADSTVGGTGAAANEISNSTGPGIAVVDSATAGHRIARNSIHDNGGLGVDLVGDGPTPNDAGDGDAGPNGLQNFPVLAGATNVCGSGVTSIAGTIDTPGPENGLVELFRSPAADPSGFGEGETFLGQTTPAFNGSIATVLPLQPVGSWVTATATDAAGNSSEFSAAVAVRATPFAPRRLEAEVAAGPTVDLAWIDEATDETGYRIERRAAGGAFALLANVPANQEAFTDPGPFAPGTTYFYRVRAENACVSDWSNVVSALVPGATSAFCGRPATHHESAQNPYVAVAAPGQLGVTWREVDGDAASLHYARLDATGAVIAGPVTLRAAADQIAGQIQAWNGVDRWGMVWYERLGDRWGLFFASFDLAGVVRSGPIGVSEPAARPVVNSMLRPGLAWDGQGWGIVWPDLRTGLSEIRYTHIAATGESKETADLVVSDGGAPAFGPRLAWNGSHHAVIWGDPRSSTLQIYLRRLAPDGTPAGASVAATATAEISLLFADVAWDGGSELGLAWIDDRDGSRIIYFRRLSLAGAPLSAETRIGDDPAIVENLQFQLALRRTATRWVVAAEDNRAGDLSGVEIRLAFADPATGAKLGADVLASTPLDIHLGDHPSLAWDGSRLLVAWHESGASPNEFEAVVQAMDETGNPGADPRRILTSGHAPGQQAFAPVIEYLGTGQAVAWLDSRSGNRSDLYLRLFDGSGLPTAAEIRVPDAPNADVQGNLALAWSGEVLAVAWREGATGQPILAFFDAAGAKLRPDVAVPQTASNQGPDLHWTGERFLVAWEKAGNPNGNELFTAAYLPNGTLVAGPNQISSAAGRSQQPALAGMGSLALVWRDTRDGNGEIYAAALDPLGARVGPEIRLTNETSDQSRPAASWNGSHFLIAWTDVRTGRNEIRALRLLADATPTGGDLQLSSDGGIRPTIATDGAGWAVGWRGEVGGRAGAILGRVDAAGVEIGSERLALFFGDGAGGSSPGLAWDGARYALATANNVYLGGEVELKSSSCVLDSTPPGCPTAPVVTLAGRDVTIAWTPAIDAELAISWQTVDRSGLRLAAVPDGTTSYVDDEAVPGDYVYSLGALNGAYLAAAGCPSVEVTVPIFADGFESGLTDRWSSVFPP